VYLICITYGLGASVSYRISLCVVFVVDLSDSVFESHVLSPMDSQQLGMFAYIFCHAILDSIYHCMIILYC